MNSYLIPNHCIGEQFELHTDDKLIDIQFLIKYPPLSAHIILSCPTNQAQGGAGYSH